MLRHRQVRIESGMQGQMAIWPEGTKSEAATERWGEGREALQLTEETRPQLAAKKKRSPPQPRKM